MNDYVLAHHGIPGMKWGIRRYQRRDGSRTAAGKRRRIEKFSLSNARDKLHVKISRAKRISGKINSHLAAAKVVTSVLPKNRKTDKADRGINKSKRISERIDESLLAAKKASEAIYEFEQKVAIGKDSADRILARGTEFTRIQSEPSFRRGRAFYAVYKHSDANMYVGLYGSQLKSGHGRSNSSDRSVYQVKLTNSKGLRMPSDQRAADIATRLAKRDPKFKKELQKTIDGSRSQFPRPMQKELFRDAHKIMQKSPYRWDDRDKKRVYEALNLSLTNHNRHEKAVQRTFYGELKKRGYGALSDINDRKYSSFHAKDPVIVFDTSSIRMQSATKLSPRTVDRMFRRENPKRVGRDAVSTTSALVNRFATSSISDIKKYTGETFREYTRR